MPSKELNLDKFSSDFYDLLKKHNIDHGLIITAQKTLIQVGEIPINGTNSFITQIVQSIESSLKKENQPFDIIYKVQNHG